MRDRVDEQRQRRIDIMSGALRIARGEPGGEPLLDRYTEITGAGRGCPPTPCSWPRCSPRRWRSCAGRRPPTPCSTTSTPTCGHVARCGR